MALFSVIAPRARSAALPAGGRVLVVSADADVRRLLELVLGLSGVATVGDSHRDAVENLKRHDYGCILLDVSADLDGVETLRKLRGTRHLPRTIVLTPGRKERLAGTDQGAFRVFEKPLVMRELIETMTECLGAAAGAA